MNRFDTFSQYIEESMKSRHVPGAAVAVIKEDDVLFQGGYGLRDIENNLPVTVDTRFAIASLTKSFTAMCVALLVDEGKLDWDTPVREYVPEFILNDPYVTAHITVRDMLSHRSGLAGHHYAGHQRNISVADFVKEMRHLKFSATFREKFQYNNLMYYATAYLIEKVSGKSWEDFVKERIFEPLGMTASSFKPDHPQPTSFGHRAKRDNEGKVTEVHRLPYCRTTALSPGAAGTIYATLTDLIKWLKVHIKNDGTLVSSANLKQMHHPHITLPAGGLEEALHNNTIITYGLGWAIEPYRGYTLIHHSGGIDGFGLNMGFVPQEKVAVIALANIEGSMLAYPLTYEGIDRALDLSDRDWSAKYHAIFDPITAARAKQEQTSRDECLTDAPHSQPLKAYAGVYAAGGYPNFSVRLNGDSLQGCLGDLPVRDEDWSGMRHYHYDVFEWDMRDSDWIKVRFSTNDSGEIDTFSIPFELEIVFKRKPLELPEDIIALLPGVYETTVEGLVYTITANNGKAYVAATGETPEELKPYRFDDDIVGFKSDRSRFDFTCVDGVMNQFTLKSPYVTLEAKRRA